MTTRAQAEKMASKFTKKLTKKAVDATVNDIYKRIGNGVQVPILKLGAILRAGEKVLSEGGDEKAAEGVMQAVLDSVRSN